MFILLKFKNSNLFIIFSKLLNPWFYTHLKNNLKSPRGMQSPQLGTTVEEQ